MIFFSSSPLLIHLLTALISVAMCQSGVLRSSLGFTPPHMVTLDQQELLK